MPTWGQARVAELGGLMVGSLGPGHCQGVLTGEALGRGALTAPGLF